MTTPSPTWPGAHLWTLRAKILASLAAICLLACSLGPRVGHAADAGSATLDVGDRALVQRGVDYIQSLKAVEGRFIQIDPKGQRSTGSFYMQRPGRARFQYDPPSELLVVADGDMVSVYDRKLKSFEQYPLEQTPLMLLLAKTVHWDHGVEITSVGKIAEGFTIEARDAHKQAPGRLSLSFSNQPIALRGWTVVDGQNQRTEVQLGRLTEKASLSPSLFLLASPHGAAEQP